MSGHPDLRPLLDQGDLAAAKRQGVLAHLRGCARCRADLAARDPSLLFTLLALEPVPAGVVERISAGTEAAVSHERRRAATRRLYGWGSLAASIVVAGLLGAYLWTQTGPTAPSPVGPERAGVSRPPESETALPAGMIELLDSPGKADVVEMTVGEVEVVMIFDEAMEI